MSEWSFAQDSCWQLLDSNNDVMWDNQGDTPEESGSLSPAEDFVFDQMIAYEFVSTFTSSQCNVLRNAIASLRGRQA